jgi:hypothetical protein
MVDEFLYRLKTHYTLYTYTLTIHYTLLSLYFIYSCFKKKEEEEEEEEGRGGIL